MTGIGRASIRHRIYRPSPHDRFNGTLACSRKNEKIQHFWRKQARQVELSAGKQANVSVAISFAIRG
ncbi:MAG TPA: hypothetical protein DDZ51_24700 [Planctomycetaceae bacterium]|nr:hypothetical protein [Planctomycetaceae bacterium]